MLATAERLACPILASRATSRAEFHVTFCTSVIRPTSHSPSNRANKNGEQTANSRRVNIAVRSFQTHRAFDVIDPNRTVRCANILKLDMPRDVDRVARARVSVPAGRHERPDGNRVRGMRNVDPHRPEAVLRAGVFGPVDIHRILVPPRNLHLPVEIVEPQGSARAEGETMVKILPVAIRTVVPVSGKAQAASPPCSRPLPDQDGIRNG